MDCKERLDRRERKHRRWVFVADTNQYSGNFEREMGTYLTGKIRKYFPDICKVLAQMYMEEAGDRGAFRFAKILGEHMDDDHFISFVGGWDTPGWFNDGVGGLFRDGQEEEAFEHHRQNYLKEAKHVNHMHPNDRKRHRQDMLARAEEPLFKWPAGMSVAIAFTIRPSNIDQIPTLEKQAKNFPRAFKQAEEIMRTREIDNRHIPNGCKRTRWITGPIPKITGTRLLRWNGSRYIEDESYASSTY